MALSGSQLTQNSGIGGQHAYAGFTANESILVDQRPESFNALFGSPTLGLTATITDTQGVNSV